MSTSRRPDAGGRSPANNPTQAHPNIWYGIQGPTPPVMRAEANNVVQPRVKPNPAPKTLPAMTMVKNTVSRPAVPAPRGRRAAPMADSTPNMAMALASMPPSATSAKITASTSTRRAPNISGAMVASPIFPGATRKGQRKATPPMNDAITMTARDRSPVRMATEAPLIGWPPRRQPPDRW
jgi:hypothetical protein